MKIHKILSMLPGEVSYLHVDDGARIEAGQNVIAIECMKQLTDIGSPVAGIVRFRVSLGEMVEQDQVLAEIEQDEKN